MVVDGDWELGEWSLFFSAGLSDFHERRLGTVARGRERVVAAMGGVGAAVPLFFDVRDLAMSGNFPIAARHASA